MTQRLDGGPIPLNIAVLTISQEVTAFDVPGDLLASLVKASGHRVVARGTVTNTEAMIRTQLVQWISDPSVEIVLATGDVSSGVSRQAVEPLMTQAIPGFAELFRWLSFANLGSSAMVVDSHAAQCGSTFVFVLPDSPVAIQTAFDQILVSQLDHRTTPRNLAMKLPRLVNMPALDRTPITTSSIATIGDLPANIDRDGVVNLRAGRRGLAVLGMLAATVVAGGVVMATNIIRKNQSIEAADRHRAASGVEVAPQPAAPAPAPQPAIAEPHVDKPVARVAPSKRNAAQPKAGRSIPAPVPRAIKAPEAPAPEQPPAVAESPLSPLDNKCDEVACAAINNERECCTPFRTSGILATPDKLDRSMITAGIAEVKASTLLCGAGTSGEAKVRVVVAPNGSVVSVAVIEASESSLGECVAAAVRAASFPKTNNGGTFSYPFVF